MYRTILITSSAITVLVAVFFASVYVLYQNPTWVIELQLIGKNVQSPETDAAQDIKAGFLRCYSANGFGSYFPGLNSANERAICASYHVTNFAGTSDAINDRAHGDAISKAVNYSSRYNKYVVSKSRLKI